MEEKDRILIETEARSKSNQHRLDGMEKQMESLHALALGVQKIAINTETIAAEQKRQGTRLDALEAKPAKRYDTIVKVVLTALISGPVGALVMAMINLLK